MQIVHLHWLSHSATLPSINGDVSVRQIIVHWSTHSVRETQHQWWCQNQVDNSLALIKSHSQSHASCQHEVDYPPQMINPLSQNQLWTAQHFKLCANHWRCVCKGGSSLFNQEHLIKCGHWSLSAVLWQRFSIIYSHNKCYIQGPTLLQLFCHTVVISMACTNNCSCTWICV